MKHLFNHRFVTLVVGFISILSIIILATSLESLVLLEDVKVEPTGIINNRALQSRATLERDWYVIVTIVVLSTFLILALIFGKPKKIPTSLPILIPLVIISLVTVWWISQGNQNINVTQLVTEIPTSGSAQATPLPSQEPESESNFLPQRINPWISFGVTFSLLLSIIIFVWFRLRNQDHRQVTLSNIAGIAEQAAEDLQSGRDYGDVVINCYADMMVELKYQRNIQRRGDLTPAEFVEVLNHTGVPFDPVHRLTTIFEGVRYGGKETSKKQIEEAAGCMGEIVSAIRGTTEGKE
jgi:hypothetical protein